MVGSIFIGMSKNLKREISTAMLRKAIFIATGIKLHRVFYSYLLSHSGQLFFQEHICTNKLSAEYNTNQSI